MQCEPWFSSNHFWYSSTKCDRMKEVNDKVRGDRQIPIGTRFTAQPSHPLLMIKKFLAMPDDGDSHYAANDHYIIISYSIPVMVAFIPHFVWFSMFSHQSWSNPHDLWTMIVHSTFKSHSKPNEPNEISLVRGSRKSSMFCLTNAARTGEKLRCGSTSTPTQ